MQRKGLKERAYSESMCLKKTPNGEIEVDKNRNESMRKGGQLMTTQGCAWKIAEKGSEMSIHAA